MIPIRGDLSAKDLGLDAEIRLQIIDDLDILISCAASVSFDDHLHVGLETNYFGTVRLL